MNLKNLKFLKKIYLAVKKNYPLIAAKPPGSAAWLRSNSGRVRDQPGLPVPKASFIVNMYVCKKRTSKFMPPQKQICTSEL